MVTDPHLSRCLAAVLLLVGAGTDAVGAPPEATVPSEGIQARPPQHLLLHNARIAVAPGEWIEHGWIEVRDGRIVAVGPEERRPDVPLRRDLAGKTVFAGFIEPLSNVGVPAAMRAGGISAGSNDQPPHEQQAGEPGARHWNRRVRPEWSVAERLDPAPEDVKALRALGFTAALAAPEAGIFKGRSALISLRDGPRRNALLLEGDVAQHVGFDFAFGSEYPGSLMGAIALVRQTLHDARWHAGANKPSGPQRIEANQALSALGPVLGGRQPVVFQLDDELDVARAARLREEFGLRMWLVGTGHEYRVLDSARRAAAPFILPLAFPEAPAVEDAETALSLSLADLQHWEQAPANPARVAAAGIEFALTSRHLKEPAKEYWPKLRSAVRAGLPESTALAALTSVPARLLGVDDRMGRIASGRLANLVVADAGLLRADDARIHEVWVEGQRHELAPLAPREPAGRWTLRWSDGIGPAAWVVGGTGDTLDVDAGGARFKLKREGDRLRGLAPAALFAGGDGLVAIEFSLSDDGIRGFRALANGALVGVDVRREAGEAAGDAPKADEPPAPIPDLAAYPAGEYGRRALPAQRNVLFRGATVWTNADAGRIEDGDVLVRDGRIAAVGRGLAVPASVAVVDARGKHLTPGLIDAHSHTAISRNVNEASHAVTSEVRIDDVLDPTDINIYRQLAGGVTTVNVLHGSANPIGGQNAVIKLRWGTDADGLRFEGAPAGIKFALGENVKQSNWGEGFRSRYPQTRMGVEQLYREQFNAARAYAAARSGKGRAQVRRDLRLEALAEILEGKRLIHIHSYRQDELLMFVGLAREYGLPVATFQHVLEGYKVASEIASIGAGASAFSDWWSFKVEAFDGIPHIGALMTRAGVVVSYNSDSDELARRLNTEAAKAIKYGGLDEEEAFKLVSLNPARQLRIDHRVGALRSGLDADLVLWSASPLSSSARVEQTWIEGRPMFAIDEDARLRAADEAERSRLLASAAVARAKALSIGPAAGDAKPADEARSPSAAAADPLTWLRFAAGRGIYHSGEALHSCEEQSHAH